MSPTIKTALLLLIVTVAALHFIPNPVLLKLGLFLGLFWLIFAFVCIFWKTAIVQAREEVSNG